VCKPVLNSGLSGVCQVHPADFIDFFLLPYRLQRLCQKNRPVRSSINPSFGSSDFTGEGNFSLQAFEKGRG